MLAGIVTGTGSGTGAETVSVAATGAGVGADVGAGGGARVGAGATGLLSLRIGGRRFKTSIRIESSHSFFR